MSQLKTKPIEHELIISRDPETMGGTPVFAGTRVPIQTLIEHLAGDYSISGFREGFPTVKHEQAVELLNRIGKLIESGEINA